MSSNSNALFELRKLLRDRGCSVVDVAGFAADLITDTGGTNGKANTYVWDGSGDLPVVTFKATKLTKLRAKWTKSRELWAELVESLAAIHSHDGVDQRRSQQVALLVLQSILAGSRGAQRLLPSLDNLLLVPDALLADIQSAEQQRLQAIFKDASRFNAARTHAGVSFSRAFKLARGWAAPGFAPSKDAQLEAQKLMDDEIDCFMPLQFTTPGNAAYIKPSQVLRLLICKWLAEAPVITLQGSHRVQLQQQLGVQLPEKVKIPMGFRNGQGCVTPEVGFRVDGYSRP